MEEKYIAIISDLHCMHSRSETQGDSLLYSDYMRKPSNQHPVQSLLDFIKKEEINADILLCAGDITNKSDPQGLVTGWSFIEELRDTLNATELLATLGNHDVDSRNIHSDYDHLDMPRKLKPNFPFDYENERKAYIADRYCFIDIDDTLVFNFNSVHSHTNSKSALEAIITDDILESIRNDLQQNKKAYKYKIAFCHHHPIKHSNVGFKYKDSDFIEKGEKLLEILDEYDFQVFIHGHKHEPKLTCYNGIPVFASGSLSAIMNLQETGSKNNFHILRLTPKCRKGVIKSWEYTYGIGWSDSKIKIKHEIGFGNRDDISAFANHILSHFEAENLERMNNSDFQDRFPDFKFFPPLEQEKLITELKKTFEIVQEYGTGHVKEIIKRN